MGNRGRLINDSLFPKLAQETHYNIVLIRVLFI